nr:ribosomal protein L32 [Trentepohlia sp. YN1317]
MSVPKKRTSYSKKQIRKQRWFKKILKFTKLFYSKKN